MFSWMSLSVCFRFTHFAYLGINGCKVRMAALAVITATRTSAQLDQMGSQHTHTNSAAEL